MTILTKFLIFAAVVFGVFVVARMGAASAIRPKLRRDKKNPDPREKDVEDLVRCPSCGAWSARGEACPCGRTPTP